MSTEQETRLEKLTNLRKAGIDPFPTKAWETRQDIFDIRSEVAESLVEPESRDESERVVAGRIRSIRGQGGLIFIDLQDGTGKIQALLKKDITKNIEKFSEFIDTADCIQVKGPLFVTKRGELTVEVMEWSILAKAILPLPDKWSGLEDTEKRFRERYLDMLSNPEVRDRLITRGKILNLIRRYLTDLGFIEAETPSLQPIYGGGFAKPFIIHHNALDIDLYLRISSEMYLKRLIAGGIDKVFEFSRIYRNEGIDLSHNPEFTMLEAQVAWEDYKYMMELTEDIFEHIAHELFGSTKIKYQDLEIEMKKPWKQITMKDAVKEVCGVDMDSLKTIEEARASAIKLNLDENEINKMNAIGLIIAYIFEEKVEKTLIQPTIVCEYPIETSPLAKKVPSDPRFVERFEIFIAGKERGNNYTELNDPIDLRQRFVDEKDREKAGFDEAHQTDWDYLKMVEHGMPPNSGLGIGIDRLVMLFTDTNSIKEVIAFPTLRPLSQNSKSEILNSKQYQNPKS